MNPDSLALLREIKLRIDIVGLIGRHIPLKKKGSEYVAVCPFHDERHPSFTVSPAKGFYHCFGCGAHGDAVDWLVNYMGVPWKEAIAKLAQEAGMELDTAESAAIRAKAAVSQTLEKAARWMHAELLRVGKASRYVFDRRKVSRDTAGTFLIGYAPPLLQDYLSVFDGQEMETLVRAGILAEGKDRRLYPKMGGRIVFPIRDAGGHVVGFSGRALVDAEPKYINSPDSEFFRKRRELFRPPEVRRHARKAGRVVWVEGFFDVLSLFDAGIPYAVAGMGTAVSDELMESVFSIAQEVVFCFDGDEAGRTAASRALKTCLPYVGNDRLVSFAFLPDNTDPDTFLQERGAKAFEEILAKATPLSSYLVGLCLEKKNATPPEKHSAILTEAARQIARIQDPIFRDSLAGMLARAFGVSDSLVCRAGGWTRNVKKPSPVSVLPVRSNRLETMFLVNLLRRPWEAGFLAEDVELETPGANGIVSALKKANLAQGAGPTEILAAFADSPYLPYIRQILQSNEFDEPVPLLAKRLELAWVERRLRDPSSLSDPKRIREMIARKASLVREIGAADGALCRTQK